ncbi:hypothetical protein EVA_21380, partial [gut metagenome]
YVLQHINKSVDYGLFFAYYKNIPLESLVVL